MFSNEATRKFFRSMTESEGISVKYSENTVEPRSFKGNQVILPNPDELTSDLWEGMAHKEISYLYKENQWLLEPEESQDKEDPTRQTAKRILGDHIAEMGRYGQYEGRDKALTRNRARITKEIQSEQPDLLDSGVKLDDNGEIIKSLLEWDLRKRKQSMDYDLQLVPDYSMGSLACGDLDDLLDSGVSNCASQQDLESLVENLMTFDPPPPPPPGEGESDSGNNEDDNETDSDNNEQSDGSSEDNGDPQDSDGGGEGDTGEQPSDGEEDGEDNDSSAGSDGDPQGDDSEASDSSEGDTEGECTVGSNGDEEGASSSPIVDNHMGSNAPKAEPKQLDLSSVAEHFKDPSIQKSSAELRDAERDFKRKYIPDASSRYIPCKNQEFLTARMFDRHTTENRGSNPGNADEIQKYYDKSVISRQIKKYLQAVSQESYLYGQKRGKLSNRSISRCYSGVREPRVFKQRQSTMLNNDTAVLLMMDCSGSMRGRKYDIASACCMLLGNTLQSVGISYEILGFSDPCCLNTYEFKKFNENIAMPKLLKRLTSGLVRTGGNCDGESVALGAERLLARPEKAKVMIVFSDGQPAGSSGGCGYTHLSGICEKIEQKTPIDLHGIGICSNAVKQFYSSCDVIHNPDLLDATLMQLLKSKVVK